MQSTVVLMNQPVPNISSGKAVMHDSRLLLSQRSNSADSARDCIPVARFRTLATTGSSRRQPSSPPCLGVLAAFSLYYTHQSQRRQHEPIRTGSVRTARSAAEQGPTGQPGQRRRIGRQPLRWYTRRWKGCRDRRRSVGAPGGWRYRPQLLDLQR